MITIQFLKITCAAVSLFVVATMPTRASDPVSPNDAARFLAGMPPEGASPLAPLTKDRAWQQHARLFDSAFGQLDKRQLARIRAWSDKMMTVSQATLFYMFSGPDFLYADAFFPKATTYVLSGLEPIGTVPDLSKLTKPAIGAGLRHIEWSLNSILNYSFFITRHMRSDLLAGQVNGTLPILYVFLARSGKTIRETSFVRLDEQGGLHPDDDPRSKAATRGVKIVFAGNDGEPRTLYYFSTDLGNDGVKTSGFLKFCETLSPGDALIKSASYLLHSGGFTRVREFLLARTALMLQDDSGVPLSDFDPKTWRFHPFGRYLGPLGIFPGRYQAKYATLFAKSEPIDFGIGYRWRANESNLLLAIRTAIPPNPPTDGAAPSRTLSNSPPPIARQRIAREPIARQRTARQRNNNEPTQGWFDWLSVFPGRRQIPAARNP